jgi:TetR/AcrR family transcriptional regulator, transcriptional repressor for nem operon
MARHKEFDRDEALQRAMEVFWARGYEATSMQNLIEHMKINRQSLYDTFGDKHSLFLQALDRYQEVETRKFLAFMERPGSVKKTFRQLFALAIDGSSTSERQRGCLMSNSTSELASRCKATAEKTVRHMRSVEEAFYRALLRGKKEGEFKDLRDPRAVARFLFNSFQGLVLTAKARPDRKALEDVVKVTLSVLD